MAFSMMTSRGARCASATAQRPAARHSSLTAHIQRPAIASRQLRRLLARAEGDKGIAEEAKNAAEDVKDGAKNAVEEAEEAFRNQANKAVSQKGVIEGTVTEPLSQGKAATDPDNAWDNAVKEAGKNETEKLGTEISIPDALRFRGVGPEHINSRLAMIGVTTGYLTKLITGENTLDQYQTAPIPVILTFILFITASLIPITKGVTPEKAQQGIWTTKAEILQWQTCDARLHQPHFH